MKRFLQTFGLTFIILVILFCSFEVALRLFWKMSALKGGIYRTSSNKILRYELRPNTKAKYDGYDVSINSDGFRGREYSLKKPENTYRIALIGDSVAFGRMIPFDDNLGSRLEAALKNLCPAKNFEVLNMGVEGYNTIQELEVLKTKALKYHPDLVVVYYCFNDPDYPEYYFEKNFLNQHSMLARYILYRVKKYRIKKDRLSRGIKTIEDNYKYLYGGDCWQHTKQAVLQMGDLTAARDIPMVLLIVPEMSEAVKDFQAGYPFWYINELLENIKHKNIVVIDPVREFSRLGLKREEFVVWAYANRKANEIIAGYTLKKLEEQGINFCN